MIIVYAAFAMIYHITLFSLCLLLLQGNVNLFCVKDCKNVWNVSWFAREVNMFEMIVQIDNSLKTLYCMLPINIVSVVYGNGS